MLIIPKKTKHKKRPEGVASATPPPPAAGPVLVMAEIFGQGEPMLRTVFDRAVDFSAFVYGTILAYDGQNNHHWYKAVNPTFNDSELNVVWELSEQDEWGDDGMWLDASAATGVVAVDGGGVWAGATDLELPFP